MPKGIAKKPLEKSIKIRLSKLGDKNPAKRIDVRKKMSLARIGKPSPNYWLGKKMSKETKKKMSISHRGEKSYLWKGGITPINKKIRDNIEYRLWREAVFARDKKILIDREFPDTQIEETFLHEILRRTISRIFKIINQIKAED